MKKQDLKKLVREELQAILSEAYTIDDVEYDETGSPYVLTVDGTKRHKNGFLGRKLVAKEEFKNLAKQMGYTDSDIKEFLALSLDMTVDPSMSPRWDERYSVKTTLSRISRTAREGLKLAPYAKMIEELGYDYRGSFDSIGMRSGQYDVLCMFDAIKQMGCFEDKEGGDKYAAPSKCYGSERDACKKVFGKNKAAYVKYKPMLQSFPAPNRWVHFIREFVRVDLEDLAKKR